MPEDPTRAYPLTPYEAELLACFRNLSEAKQGAVAMLMASLSETVRQPIVTPVRLSLVSKK